MDAWTALSGREEDSIWKRFDLAFRFRPSVSQGPGIIEPRPFKTYSIAHYYGHADAARLEKDLESKARNAFQDCTPIGARLYALNWQHPCYWLRPHQLASDVTWKVPALPNGDYYVFLEEQFEFGWFGHPWEQTICVFGSRLLNALETHSPLLFSTCARSAI
jgi:hypothetical protein